MNAYICHYTPLKERKENMIRECKEAGIDPIFIEEFDREKLTPENTARFDKKLPISKVSLILKQVEAWKQIKECEQPWALILEDDALFCPDFLVQFNKYMEETPKYFDILMINYGCDLHIPEMRIEEGRNIYKRGVEPTEWGGNGGTRCTEAYVISRNCAGRFLDIYESLSNESIKKPLDFWMNDLMRESNSEVYWAEPCLVKQGSLLGVFDRSL